MGTMYRDSEDATFVFYLPSPAECESDAEYEGCVASYEDAVDECIRQKELEVVNA